MEKNIKILDTLEKYKQAREFWIEKLPAKINSLNMLYDSKSNPSYSKEEYDFVLGVESTTRLLNITKNQDLLIYIILLAILSIEVKRYTGDHDPAIGIPVYPQVDGNRLDHHHLIYRTDLSTPKWNLKQFMGKVKTELQQCYSHQHYPVHQLCADMGLDCSLELAMVNLAMENLHPKEAIQGMIDSPHNELALSFIREGEEIRGKAVYNQNLFKAETVQRFVKHYLQLLENALRQPDQQISAIQMISEQEQEQILRLFNQSSGSPFLAQPIHQLFEKQVAENPNQMAVSYPEQGQYLTYQELDEKSNQLARVLREEGIGKDQLVAIMMEGSLEMVIGFLGILKAGGAYLPIDPDDPVERIGYMLQDSHAQLLLTQKDLMAKVQPYYQGAVLDLQDSRVAAKETTRLENITHPNDLAYVIYTSGSTGQPKGVLVEHRGVGNLAQFHQRDFELTSKDRILQFAPCSFDASVSEVYMALLTGATLYLVTKETITNYRRFEEYLNQHQITVLTVPPMYLRHLKPEQVQTLRVLLTAGSATNLELVKDWQDRVTYVNAYGPTETTVCATIWKGDLQEELSVPIGKPIDHTQVFILDEDLNMLPVGVTGELCVRSVGLARGYLNRPELTNEKFVTIPFLNYPSLTERPELGEKMYRTGDMARWLPDGNIEFLGRRDEQVKIRGFRVELGEVEGQISQTPGVKTAVVTARKDEADQSYLCAYLVTDKEFTLGELRDYLQTKLPEYMIPERFVQLDELPMTKNGKIDRKALPAPDGSIGTGRNYQPPTTETEKKLTQIWETLLRVEKIGVDDNFFALGGHSLKGATLVNQVQDSFQVNLPLGELFRLPTIRELAEYIDQVAEPISFSIPKVEEREYYPAWPGQARLFTLQTVDPESVVYNLPSMFIIQGKFDPKRLEAAFGKVIQRHETLRTYFRSVDDQIVMQILDEVLFELEYDELTGEEEIEQAVSQFIQPFNLGLAPLFRAKVWKVATEKYLLLFDIHHIIADGVGGMTLLHDLMAYYDGAELPPLKVQYKDFAVWQEEFLQSEQVKKQEEYLLELFSGELPVLKMPTDFQRPRIRSTVGSSISLTVSRELAGKLRNLALETETTLYMVSLSAFYILLYKYSGQNDIIIGSPAAGRPHADLDQIIGLFINNIVMRNYPTGSKGYKDFLREIKASALQAFANQDYQFDQLVEKLNLATDLSRNPLFDVFFAFQNYEFAEVERSEFTIHPYAHGSKISKFDLLLFTYDHQDELTLNLEYNTDLYKRETIERMLQHYLNIFSQIVADPEQNIGELIMLSKEEREQVLFEFNQTQLPGPVGQTIHQRFEEQVQRTPDQIALISGADQLTYRQLNQKANRLARKLIQAGIGQESVVGVMLDKSTRTVISLLAILKAGGAYLPIDPDYPQERILYMLENANAKLLLTDRESKGEVPFTLLQNIASSQRETVTTRPRSFIQEFDQLPCPDASLIDLSKYKDTIGMASVTNCIGLQTTRGCPYQCVFCHKVWSKNHVFRSAENIYQEVEYYYQRGVTHFEILDDCFNLNVENGKRFFEMIIKNGLKIQIYFPNGLRGDLLTPDYIDLMVEAGVVNINLSLETASPRLQKLVKKHLDLDQFKSVMEYIATQHPNVILEMATMHGFPTETEEEAMMTLNFIKDIQWIHFPYIHILKVYPNTEMEALALKHGVREEDILKSVNLAYHEIPETLPFSKTFTRKYQAEFLNEYFLLPERLKAVLPVQMRLLSEEALVQKYNAYLPTQIQSLEDVLKLAGITDFDLSIYRKPKEAEVRTDKDVQPKPTIFDHPYQKQPDGTGKRILLLDLSQSFSSENMLYKVTEKPLGLLYLLTYLKQELGDQVSGRIYKSGVDFDSFAELGQLVKEYQPELIGIRSLSLYKEFFHETVSLLKQWVPEATIVTGGPYSTSDYQFILKDPHVDLAVLGEGEYTFTELIRSMLEYEFRLPPEEVLAQIEGIAYAQSTPGVHDQARQVWFLEETMAELEQQPAGLADEDLQLQVSDQHLAYVMYTSGSTGKPKGVMVEHRQVMNCINWMQDEFKLDEQAVVVQRTNLTFDPSVWEIFWPLQIGARVELLTINQGKDAQYLVQLMKERQDLTMLYSPASMVHAMTYLLKDEGDLQGCLKMPWFLIGAESITREMANEFYTYLDGTIVNTYGPTECAINNTYYYLERNDTFSIVPIGRPIANNQIYILSQDLNPQPVQIPGEIYIAGESVARGYINNLTQTQERFLENPFGSGRLYKTSDLGRWLPDGNIEILGRMDEQVKIRGYRIELGEIESALVQHNLISESAVIVRDPKDDVVEVEYCEECGISTAYPGVELNQDRICTICETLADDQSQIQAYFKKPEDLSHLIRETKDPASDYDCILLYAGGLAAGYALYQLVEEGHRVLAVTYDHGYFSKSERENIKKITGKLGVDHIFLQHEKSDEILQESIRNAGTVCKGCFFTSSALAADYANQHQIKVVIGATLSPGQIIENKVYDLVQRGISDLQQMEEELAQIQKMNPGLNHHLFDLIGIEDVNSGSVYDQVKMVDFYRYYDLTNEELLQELYRRDPYWKTKKEYAIYSTKCPIKEIGDCYHLEEKGYHYYGSATSWEYRLGHLSKQNLQEDLTCHVSSKACANFLRILGYQREKQEELESKYICAYLVADEELSVSDLRGYLAKFVPDYMIPSYFVYLSEMPLTQEGKVNRKVLPIPEGDMFTGVEYVAPRNRIEEVLAQVWQEVLGVDQVGIEDNFFDLGGDSIRAIRVISGVQRYGYKFEVKDLFTTPEIKNLSAKVTKKELEVSQEPVVGETPLLPIQQWFFANQFTDQHHWNQAVMLYRAQGFDQELVEKVFAKIVEHHDVLRMVFKRTDVSYQQWNRDLSGELFQLQIFDYTQRELERDQVIKDCNQIHRSMDLTTGPLVKLGLFKTRAGEHLLISIHHLVMDGVSWRILFEDFVLGYEQASKGKAIAFQEKTNSYQEWACYLTEYAKRFPAREAAYWKQVEGLEIQPLPKDQEVEDACKIRKNTQTVSVSLSEAETRELLTNVNKVYNTNLNDILLTALGQMIKGWTGQEKVLIHLEGHGRDQLTDQLDLNRTIGWFTSQYPVLLELPNEVDLGYQIKFTKESLRRVPLGIGYGILKYLSGEGLTRHAHPEISFNYLGQFDQDLKGEVVQFSNLPTGDLISPHSETLYALEINGMVAEGQLRISFTYNGNEYHQETIQRLSQDYQKQLALIIDHCVNKESAELTPTDYGNSNISLEELQELEESLQDLFSVESPEEESEEDDDLDIFADF